MTPIEVTLLAVVQGLTEFLPVSSSGHLVIIEEWLKLPGSRLTLNVALHFGTLLAVLVVYHRRIAGLLSEHRRLVGPLIVGTLPAAIVGLGVKRYAPAALDHALLAGAMLIATGALLLWSSRRSPGKLDYPDITYRQALLIGLFQALAILPGLSRSGSTIVAGMAVGLRRDAAATFSFLLAIPVISGACVLEFFQPRTSADDFPPPIMLGLGVAVAFVVGLASLWWLLAWLGRGKLHYFAWWCIPLGAAVCLSQLWEFAFGGS